MIVVSYPVANHKSISFNKHVPRVAHLADLVSRDLDSRKEDSFVYRILI